MKAPKSAYAQINGILVVELVRRSGTVLNNYVARFLKGAADKGGYSTTDAGLAAAIKSLFYLDHLKIVRRNGTVLGFIGGVNVGGANAKYHNMTKRYAGLSNEAKSIKYLSDAGLNTMGRISSVTVRYAFGNYWRIDVQLLAAFYIKTSAVVKMQESLSAESYQYSNSGEARPGKSVTIVCANRGGVVHYDTAKTVYVVSEVSNEEGTLTFSTTVRMLAPLFFGPFVPVSSYAETPVRNDPDLCTFLISSELEDVIYNAVKDKTAPSLPEAIASGTADTSVLLLGEGEMSGVATDDVMEDYYNYVTKGSGSFNAPADGYWVNVTGRYINMAQVFYGVQIVNGKVTSIFRARPYQTNRAKITLTITVSEVSGSDNKYLVSFALSASETPTERVNLTISALQVRATQTGASLAAQFTNMDGSLFNGRTGYLNSSGISMAPGPAYLTTSATGNFWVTATAEIDSNDYDFINNGGQLGGGSGSVTPAK